MEKIYYWITFVFNIIISCICCILIIKRKIYTSISIRSPLLLLMTILGNFFMLQIIILNNIFDSYIISSFYYIFRLLMFLPIILRTERLIHCCETNNLTQADLRRDSIKFMKKRYIYKEQFYVKILIIIILAAVIIFVASFLSMDESFQILAPYTDVNEYFINKMIIWISWNFVEHAVLMTYIFRIFSNFINQRIKIELILFFILWYVYSIFSSLFYYISKTNDFTNLKDDLFLVTICFHFASLFLNGYFPIILSYTDKISISYHFNPRLMNNLYLFLTNEECYDSFNEFLKKSKDSIKYCFFLTIYTHIMKYKIMFYMSDNDNTLQKFDEANEIFNLYFEGDNYVKEFGENIITKIRNDCKIFELNNCTSHLFDDALKLVFNELNKQFEEFKKTEKYIDLFQKIKLSSYIHCKLYNTGLISKF